MNYLETDGGREGSGLREKLDCTVRATAAAFGICYSEAHAKLKAAGRRNNCRFAIQKVVDAWGLERCPEFSCRLASSVLPELSQGHFIVRISKHVFAVVDGVVHDLKRDTVQPSQRIKMVYRVKI